MFLCSSSYVLMFFFLCSCSYFLVHMFLFSCSYVLVLMFLFLSSCSHVLVLIFLFNVLVSLHHSEICASVEVKSFPTFKFYRSGQFVSDYTGARNAQGYVQSLNNLAGAPVEGSSPPPPLPPKQEL